jgi:hypothetical protein
MTNALLTVFGRGFSVPQDLLALSGLGDPQGRYYHRDLGFFAGFLATLPDEPETALMLTAGERAKIKAEQDVLTSRQKIAEIELRTAEEQTKGAQIVSTCQKTSTRSGN